jgi:hypothetical protein
MLWRQIQIYSSYVINSLTHKYEVRSETFIDNKESWFTEEEYDGVARLA